MAKLSIVVAATSQTVNIFIQDSSSTIGAGLAGLVYNTAGLTAYYALPRAAPVAITLATLAAATSAYSSGGFFELDATHTKGLYRFDIPDAALASGRFSTIYLYGATNMAPVVLEIELTVVNNQDVNYLLQGLKGTTNPTAGALVTSGTGTAQLSVTSGQVILQAGTGTGQLDFTSGVVKANAVQLLGTGWLTPGTAGTPDVNTKLLGGTAQTGRDIGASVLLSSGTGTGQVKLSSGYVAPNWGDVGNPTTTVGLSNTTISTTQAITSVSGSVGSVTGAVGSVTGAVGSVTAAVPLSAGDSPVMQSGTATAGGASTITIQTALGADSLPVGCEIKITSGTGAKQCRVITAYVDSTQVVTVDRAWTTNPNNTSVYSILYRELPALSSGLKITDVALVDTLTTYTGNTVQTGDAYARIGAGGVSLSAIPDEAGVTTLLGRLTSTRSGYLDNLSGGAVALASGVTVTTNNDKTGYTLTVTPPTAAQNATAVWQDATAGDFTTAGSIGKSLFNAFTVAGGSVYTVAALANAPTGTTPPTTAQIATAVWEDLTAGGDFGTAGSIGLLLTTDINATISSRSAPATAQTIDLTTAVPTSNTANTVGDCLNAARAQGFGKWTIVGTTLTLYAADGTTAVRTFTLDSSTAPTQRV